MSSPTTKATALSSSETSDNKNKNKENIEDCSCNSGSNNTDIERDICQKNNNSSSSVVCMEKTQQKQQQLNNFENNSKLQQKGGTFGGNLTKSDSNSFEEADYFNNKLQDKEEGELSANNSETIDSGFISGPQNSSNQFYDNNLKETLSSESDQYQTEEAGAVGGTNYNTSTTNITKFNILPKEQATEQQQQQQQRKKETAILDSGCIDEENFDDYEQEVQEEEQEEDEKKIKNIETSVESNSGSKNQQVRIESSNTTQNISSSSPSTSISTNTSSGCNNNKSLNSNNTTITTTTNNTNEDPMILKQNVDAGMSEWFCKLSLQTDSTNAMGVPSTSAGSYSAQVAGVGMNNLDINSERRAANTIALENQRLAAQQQTPSVGPGVSITLSNAWEQFFQQNDDGDTPLHLAVIFGRIDVVIALLRTAPHPCLLNIQNDEAQTPLHLAARTSQPAIIRMLLLAGAEPRIGDRDGNTALHLACINGEIQCVRTLLEKFSASEIVEAHRQFGHLSTDKSMSSLNFARLPSDLEIRNYDGERCVHLVARNGNIDILRLLVLYGADINAREGRSGLTPLHIAIECCNEKLANFLLDECEKLNVETATYAGLTAYQIACMLNKSQLQTMLENYGAEPLTPPDSDYDSSDIEDLDELYDRFGDPGYFVGYSGGNPMTVA